MVPVFLEIPDFDQAGVILKYEYPARMPQDSKNSLSLPTKTAENACVVLFRL